MENIKEKIAYMIKRDIQNNNEDYVSGNLLYLKKDLSMWISECETNWSNSINQIITQIDSNHAFVNTDFNEKLTSLQTDLDKFSTEQNQKFRDLEAMLNKFGLFIHKVDDKVNENTNNDIDTATSFQTNFQNIEEKIKNNQNILKIYEEKIQNLEDQLRSEKILVEGMSKANLIKFDTKNQSLFNSLKSWLS